MLVTTMQRFFYGAIAAGLICLAFVLLKPVLTPVVLSGVLAYALNPMVKWLTKHMSVPRTVAASLVLLLLFSIVMAALGLVLPLLLKQAWALVQQFPTYVSQLPFNNIPLPRFIHQAVGDLSALPWQQWLDSYGDTGVQALQQVGKNANQSLQHLATVVSYMLLVPLLIFYWLRDSTLLLNNIQMLVPPWLRTTLSPPFTDINELLGVFLRGQLSVMVVLGTFYAVGLAIIGLEFGVLIGFIAGLISIVPYLGSLIGVVIAGVVAYLQFNAWLPLLAVSFVFIAGQLLEGFVLTPTLIGNKIGLHPAAVLLTVMLGGYWFGFTGVLLALPMTAIALVFVRYAITAYLHSSWYQDGRQP